MQKAQMVILAQTLLQFHPVVSAKAKQEQARIFKVGTVTRSFAPREPYNWRDAQTHALITQIWYPAEPASVEQPQWVGPPKAPLFSARSAAPGATIAASPARFPLIMLSHGTGGSAGSMAWLSTQLAAHGYIVAGPQPPPHNSPAQKTSTEITLFGGSAQNTT